ncbi:MAG: hypothetical protein ACI4EQ_05810 [Lachnospiraceae bacterium]
MENNQREQSNEKIMEENSMNFGLGACIVLYLAIFKDILKWGFGIEGYHLNGIIGTVAIISFLVILQCNLSGRIRKKQEFKNFIDVCTFVSVIVFSFENAVFDFVEEGNRFTVSIAFSVLIGLPLIALVCMFFKKK